MKDKHIYQDSTIKALNFETKGILTFTVIFSAGLIVLFLSWLVSC
ncbi:MAG: hypothetical protein ACRCXZ_09675 [Patescibacteria group bacterium]